MKRFVKPLVIVFQFDIALGLFMTCFVYTGEANFLFKIIDGIISFSISLWNRLFTNNGIYAS